MSAIEGKADIDQTLLTNLGPTLPKANVMQITWRMDNSGVRECGRSSAWLRLPHPSFAGQACSASSAPEWEDRHEVVAAISPGFRCRHLGPHSMGPPSYEYLAEANPVLHANRETHPETHRGLLRPIFRVCPCFPTRCASFFCTDQADRRRTRTFRNMAGAPRSSCSGASTGRSSSMPARSAQGLGRFLRSSGALGLSRG